MDFESMMVKRRDSSRRSQADRHICTIRGFISAEKSADSPNSANFERSFRGMLGETLVDFKKIAEPVRKILCSVTVDCYGQSGYELRSSALPVLEKSCFMMFHGSRASAVPCKP